MEVGDVFGEDEENLTAAMAPLPDLEDDDGPMRQEGDGEGGDEEGVAANLQRLAKGAAKKRVMRPQPKLDAERLKGERGIALLPKLFEGAKFKGHGHEAQDLKTVMSKLEHWAHRLFPKMPFDEFIARMDKLGAKKAVQNTVKRIRLDMPLLDDDYMRQYDGDGPPEDPENPPEEHSTSRQEEDEVDAEEAFEQLMQQDREDRKRREQEEADNLPMNGVDLPPAGEDLPPAGEDVPPSRADAPPAAASPARSTGARTEDSTEARTTVNSTPQKNTPLTPQGMTAQAKARMEENKRKALERRAAKLGVPVSALMSPGTKTASSSVLPSGDSGQTCVNSSQSQTTTKPTNSSQSQTTIQPNSSQSQTTTQPNSSQSQTTTQPNSSQSHAANEINHSQSEAANEINHSQTQPSSQTDRNQSQGISQTNSSQSKSCTEIDDSQENNKMEIDCNNDSCVETETGKHEANSDASLNHQSQPSVELRADQSQPSAEPQADQLQLPIQTCQDPGDMATEEELLSGLEIDDGVNEPCSGNPSNTSPNQES